MTANAVYATAVTPLLVVLVWLLGNEVTGLMALWAAFVLVACSVVTSVIWLISNHLLSKVGNA